MDGDFRTSHIVDTWRYAETLARILQSAGRERKTEGGICVGHMDLPQGFLGNYREAGQLHQFLTSLGLT